MMAGTRIIVRIIGIRTREHLDMAGRQFSPAGKWCGASDLAGNVWDGVKIGMGLSSTPVTNPTGPSSGSTCLRGGSWYSYIYLENNYRGAYRLYNTLSASGSTTGSVAFPIKGPSPIITRSHRATEARDGRDRHLEPTLPARPRRFWRNRRKILLSFSATTSVQRW